YHLHFTPTHASWLNQVERWFALRTQRQIKRGSHASVRELEAAIREFIMVHNQKSLTVHLEPDCRSDPSFHCPFRLRYIGCTPPCYLCKKSMTPETRAGIRDRLKEELKRPTAGWPRRDGS